jgi:hypothetical protein
MTALRTLAELAAQDGLEFIVCGGHAVNAYQVIRKTGDIDLVVRERDASRWKERLTGLGYAIFHESGAFLQLQPRAPAAWPVDLLFVDDGTFDALRRSGTLFQFGDATCFIPSLGHLIAMKLHALRFSGEKRMRRDAVDIIDLAEQAGIDLEGDHFRSLCDRFADGRVLGRILQYAGKKTP